MNVHAKSRLILEPLRALRPEDKGQAEPARTGRGPSPARYRQSRGGLAIAFVKLLTYYLDNGVADFDERLLLIEFILQTSFIRLKGFHNSVRRSSRHVTYYRPQRPTAYFKCAEGSCHRQVLIYPDYLDYNLFEFYRT